MTCHPLQTLRIECGLTQDQLARRAKINRATVYRIEARIVIPYHETQRRILQALGVPFTEHRRVFGRIR